MLIASPHYHGYHMAGRAVSQSAMSAISLAMAVVGVVVRPMWRVGRLAVTAVHEGGHAVAAVVAGRTVTAMHLRADTSGVTFHQGSRRWSGRLLTAVAGYPAPGAVAVAGAALTAARHGPIWLAILAALGAVMVVRWVRNLFGIVIIAGCVAALAWLLASGTDGEIVLVGTIAVWYLAIGGLRSTVELLGARGPSDAFDVGRLLHLPTAVGKAGFVMAAAVALAACAGLLFHL